MSQPGWLQWTGSRVLSSLGLTRMRHWKRVAAHVATLEAEITRLNRELQTRPASSAAEAELRRVLTRHQNWLGMAVQEMAFRAERWRDCAEGRLSMGRTLASDGRAIGGHSTAG